MAVNLRVATFRLVVLSLLAAALAGCTVGPRFQRGPKLRTEQRNARHHGRIRPPGRPHLDAAPPGLVVWLDSRTTTSAEERDIYQKVQVIGHRRLSFEPTFFLWPYNLVRAPVGLVGCAFVGLDMGLHYVGRLPGRRTGRRDHRRHLHRIEHRHAFPGR